MTDQHDPEQDSENDPATGDNEPGYEVGYRKPPRQHRFKPGNQAARNKKRAAEKTVSLAAAIGDALKRKITVKRGEKVVSLAAAEVFSERLVQGIARGSSKEMITIYALIQQHAPDLLKVDPQVFEVIYRQADGSSVPLPPAHLYEEEGLK